MVLGTGRIELHIPDSGSLKGKRKIIKGLKDRIRSRFNVSVAEVDHLDLWQRASLGIAMVSNDAYHVQKTLSQVIHLVQQEHRVEVLDYEITRR